MKQHFGIVIVSAFVALIVLSIVALVFNPADALNHMIDALTANPNDPAQKLAFVNSNS